MFLFIERGLQSMEGCAHSPAQLSNGSLSRTPLSPRAFVFGAICTRWPWLLVQHTESFRSGLWGDWKTPTQPPPRRLNGVQALPNRSLGTLRWSAGWKTKNRAPKAATGDPAGEGKGALTLQEPGLEEPLDSEAGDGESCTPHLLSTREPICAQRGSC